MRVAISLLSATLFVLSSCQDTPLVDQEGVACPGATRAQLATLKPSGVLQGTVQMVPLPAEVGFGGWSLISRAYAMVTEAEEPVAGAKVRLYEVEGLGQPKGKVLLETQTDARGRWCLGIPREPWQGKLLLKAVHRGRQVQLPVWWDFDLDMSAQSEAVVQVLQRARVDAQAMTPERWLNLMTVADTSVGLLWPRELPAARTHQELVGQMIGQLEGDQRFLEVLRGLPVVP